MHAPPLPWVHLGCPQPGVWQMPAAYNSPQLNSRITMRIFIFSSSSIFLGEPKRKLTSFFDMRNRATVQQLLKETSGWYRIKMGL
jgi:hypothetical protein